MSAFLKFDAKLRLRLTATLAAGLAGFAVNCFPLILPGGAPLSFGEVFSLLIALTLGPFYGALTAVLVEIPIWIHTLGGGVLLIHVMEAIAVAILVRRRVLPLFAGAMFWVLIATPMVLTFGHSSGGIPTEALWTVASKDILNGVINVTLAELISGVPSVRSWLGAGRRRALPLRQYLARGFMLASAGAFLALSLALNWVQGGRLEKEVGGHLEEAAARVTAELDHYIDRNQAGLLDLASVIDPTDLDRAAIEPRLQRFHALYPGFQAVAFTGMSGDVKAVDPQVGANGQPILNHRVNLTDRDYFQKTVQTRAPYVSDVFLGREVASSPIVMLTVPLFDRQGTMVGIVGGSLRCSGFQPMVESLASLKDRELVILDQKSRVIFASTGAPFQPLENLAGSSMLTAAASNRERFFQYRRAIRGKDGQRVDNRLVILGHSAAGWTVVLSQPFSSVVAETTSYYLITVAWVLIGLLASAFAARQLSESLTRPVEGLAERMGRVVLDGVPLEPSDVPANAPLEVSQLVGDFEQVTSRLSEYYGQLQAALADRGRLNEELSSVMTGLELRVEERTAELAEAKSRAEEASRLKSEFLANMSHEIRTPMNGVLGMLDLLMDTPMADDQRDLVETARDSAAMLLEILKDILDFSKIEAGRMELDPMPFSVATFLKETAHPLEVVARRKGLELRCSVAPSIPALLVSNPLRLRQVLINLVSNAIKFTKVGFVEIAASVQSFSEDAAVVRFTVIDSGIGLDPSQQQVIFEPFRQADGSTTRNYGGIGLGLSISKRLAELMGGEIGVTSLIGEGSQFWFTVKMGLTATRESSLSGLAGAIGKSSSVPLNILVAEDNAVNQRVVKTLLERRGHKVGLAETGVIALGMTETQHFDVILMDVQMPEMDGIEATRLLRERDRRLGMHTPVVMLTAHTMLGDRERFLASGADGYVSKPIQIDQLLAEIDAVLTPKSAPLAPLSART